MLPSLRVAAALLVATGSAAAQTTFTVTSVADPGTGACDATECTLREAIVAANASANANASQPDRIHFAIPGGGLKTIIPLTPLPTITDPVVIDGYTQTGASANTLAVGNDAVLRIELNGNGATFRAFEITAGGSTVRGVVINRFDGNGGTDGFQLRTRGGNTIAGNWVGTSADGTAAQNNSRAAIYLENSAVNIIGGLAPADRNVLLGSANPVIYDAGTGGGHTIRGNYIGTDARGLVPLGQTGVYLSTGSNRIGGTDPGAGNVISVTGRDGIVFSEAGASDNVVYGNYIGVGADGATPLGSNTSVVIQRASRNQIGGPSAAHRNVIGGATGVRIFGSGGTAQNNVVQGNYIGTNAMGTALLTPAGGAGAGVLVSTASGNTIGGAASSTGNVIAGFATSGVRLENGSIGNTVTGNLIGTDASGQVALPNGRGVVVFEAGGVNTIGRRGDERNVISGNAGAGVYITGTGAATLQGNYIGVAADGTTPLGNGASGIEIGAASRTYIGGASAGNVIAYNGGHVSEGGVRVTGGTGTSILGNAIYANFGYGIDLGTDGATVNDAGDPDDGPNRLQNTPEIVTVAFSGGQLTVGYRIDSDLANANYPFQVEFFRSVGGQGAAFLGADTYAGVDHTTCGSPPCTKTVAFVPAAPLTLADALVLTATDLDGNTSEFTATARGVPTEAEGVAATVLQDPSPNPGRGRVTIRYALAEAGPVRLAVLDLLGREVAVLVDGARPAGHAVTAWTGAALAAGVYTVRLEAGPVVQSRRLVVVR